MFAHSLRIPCYSWLATLAFVAAMPPFLLAWLRCRGRPSRGLILGAVSVMLLCGVLPLLDMVYYWQVSQDPYLWGQSGLR
jgi:hypothetical protein